MITSQNNKTKHKNKKTKNTNNHNYNKAQAKVCIIISAYIDALRVYFNHQKSIQSENKQHHQKEQHQSDMGTIWLQLKRYSFTSIDEMNMHAWSRETQRYLHTTQRKIPFFPGFAH